MSTTQNPASVDAPDPSHEAAVRPPAGYPDTPDPGLYNADLAPADQTWNAYNIFAFWMADIHSVGGYVFAASLFSLGLVGWQVLISLVAGIVIVQVFANLVARPSQRAGVPFPVVCRMSFGTKGANVPAIIRGLIAVVWYGIQTWLASNALMMVLLRWFPEVAPLSDHYFVGLSALGWLCFALMWILQALVFWRGMDTIRRFNDWAGPLVYLVMFALAGWVVWRVGPNNVGLSLSDNALSGGDAIWQMVVAAVLVASYFAGPTLNFGDFSRYCQAEKAVRRGNFWGLPINFLVFSLITVIVVSGTPQLFGEMITDPMETVSRIDSFTAALLGVFVLVAATIGINIVANFVAPAFDFAHVAPTKISWRTGGMIAAVGSIFLTPWNLFNNPELIHYTVGLLAALIGPLYGIILVDYYLVRRQAMDVDALFSAESGSPYHYRNGVNPIAMRSLIIAGLISIPVSLFAPGDLSSFAVFIGGGIAALAHGWQSGAWRSRS